MRWRKKETEKADGKTVTFVTFLEQKPLNHLGKRSFGW
jgi:hypothetical protein